MTQRIVSGAIALAYLLAAYFLAGSEIAMQVAIVLVIPLGLIWFSEEMGDFTGRAGHSRVSSASPGCMVAAGGWVLLLIPIAYTLIWHFASNE